MLTSLWAALVAALLGGVLWLVLPTGGEGQERRVFLPLGADGAASGGAERTDEKTG